MSKVYGARVMAPLSWGITPAPNGSRQVRVVAQVKSKAEFLRLLQEAGCASLTMHALNYDCSTTGNEAEVEAASSEPGAVFYATSDSYRADYRKVPSC